MRSGVIRAAAAIALAVLGAVAVVGSLAPRGRDGERVVVGYYTPGQEIALGNLTVEGGPYRLGYTADVQFISPDPTARVRCGLVDTTGRIGHLGDRVSTVPGNGEWTRISATSRIDVPDISLGLRCSPTSSAAIGVTFRGVRIGAERLRD
jgi:hypothetical protein